MGEPIRAPRGTRDILPPETEQWSAVEEIMRSFARRYGYQEIRTPIFEHTFLFLRGIGEGSDIANKEMYTFEDKKGRSLTLRPELTAPIVRSYLENQQVHHPLIKWYYLGPGFRYEKPQSGRFRQFHQFGVEAIGSLSPALDAEIIILALEIFRELKLSNLEVKLNSIGCKICRRPYREKLRSYFLPYREKLCADCQFYRFEKNPLRILDCKVPRCRDYLKEAPKAADFLCAECQEHFREVQENLGGMEFSFSLDPYLVRGLEYYTKTVFEIVSSSLGTQNSLCGGGRYDDLVEILGGPSRPAVGFAAGMERILMVRKAQGISFPPKEPDLFVISLGQKAENFLWPVILGLRRKSLHVERDYSERSLSSQLKEADRIGAKWVLLLGENELESGKAVLRNMKERIQEEIPLSNLAHTVEERILSGFEWGLSPAKDRLRKGGVPFHE